MVSRRALFEILTAAGTATLFRHFPAESMAIGRKLTTYRSPNCLCCAKWIEYMRNAMFTVEEKDEPAAEIWSSMKHQLGIPTELGGCHTSLAGGFVFEGHVPADLIEKVLRDRPPIRGLAVPGMPERSPGMNEGLRPSGLARTRKDYIVYQINSDGTHQAFAKVRG